MSQNFHTDEHIKTVPNKSCATILASAAPPLAAVDLPETLELQENLR